MKLTVNSIHGLYETTTRHELDRLIENPNDLTKMFANLVDHLLDNKIILPDDLTVIFDTYRTYKQAPL